MFVCLYYSKYIEALMTISLDTEKHYINISNSFEHASREHDYILSETRKKNRLSQSIFIKETIKRLTSSTSNVYHFIIDLLRA